jgi:beta-galactosidase
VRLAVVKWSDASFVEDQDQWWHGGITRSVFLFATGHVRLGDVRVVGGLARRADGTPDVDGGTATGTLGVTVDVETPDGRGPGDGR